MALLWLLADWPEHLLSEQHRLARCQLGHCRQERCRQERCGIPAESELSTACCHEHRTRRSSCCHKMPSHRWNRKNRCYRWIRSCSHSRRWNLKSRSTRCCHCFRWNRDALLCDKHGRSFLKTRCFHCCLSWNNSWRIRRCYRSWHIHRCHQSWHCNPCRRSCRMIRCCQTNHCFLMIHCCLSYRLIRDDEHQNRWPEPEPMPPP